MSETHRNARWHSDLKRVVVVTIVFLVSCGNQSDAALEFTMRSRVGMDQDSCSTAGSTNDPVFCARWNEEQHFQAADGGRATVPAHARAAFFSRRALGNVACGGQDFDGFFYRTSDQNMPASRVSFELELAGGSSISLRHDRQTFVGDQGNTYFDEIHCYEAAGRWQGTSGDLQGRTGTYVWIYDSIQHTLRLVENPASDRNAGRDEEKAPAPSFTESDALEMVEAYYSAVEAGDVDAIEASFSAATFVPDVFLEFAVWHDAVGSTIVDRACESSDGEPGSFVVMCNYLAYEYVHRVVDAPATPTLEAMVVTAQGIQHVTDFSGSPDFPADSSFDAWMRANHPQDREAASVSCCGWGTIEEARANGELRHRYADLWAAYLTESGCTWDNVGC